MNTLPACGVIDWRRGMDYDAENRQVHLERENEQDSGLAVPAQPERPAGFYP